MFTEPCSEQAKCGILHPSTPPVAPHPWAQALRAHVSTQTSGRALLSPPRASPEDAPVCGFPLFPQEKEAVVRRLG